MNPWTSSGIMKTPDQRFPGPVLMGDGGAGSLRGSHGTARRITVDRDGNQIGGGVVQVFALQAPSDAVLRKMANTVAMADSVGPILDPITYRDRLEDGSLDRQRRLIALVRHVLAELREIAPEIAPLLDAQDEAPDA